MFSNKNLELSQKWHEAVAELKVRLIIRPVIPGLRATNKGPCLE